MNGRSGLNLLREIVAGQLRRLSIRECPIEVFIEALMTPLVGECFTPGAVLNEHRWHHPVWILGGLLVQTTLPFCPPGNLIRIGER